MKNSNKLYLKFLAVIVLTIAIPVLYQGTSRAAATDPVVFMKDTVDRVISILLDEKLVGQAHKAEREKRVMDIIEKKFDFREMSVRALARHWKDQSPQDQERFVSLFKTLLEKTYIAKIETYSGEKVIFKKAVLQGNTAIVYSDLVRKEVETPVNYKLKYHDERWMVYDLEVAGVSMLNNYRTQFASILAKENFAALIVRLEEKVSKGAAE